MTSPSHVPVLVLWRSAAFLCTGLWVCSVKTYRTPPWPRCASDTVGRTREPDGPARGMLRARGGHGRRMRTSSPTQRQWEGTWHRSPGDSDIPMATVTEGRGEKRRRREETGQRLPPLVRRGPWASAPDRPGLRPSLLTETDALPEIRPRLWAPIGPSPRRG